MQQACSLAVELGLRLESLRFLIRDREAKYTEFFDAAFAVDGIKAVWAVPRAPRMNAHCEKVVGTLRREVLNHLPIWNETYARQVLGTFARHCNCHHSHQARGQLLPLTREHPAPQERPDCIPSPPPPSARRCHKRVQVRRLTSGNKFPNGTESPRPSAPHAHEVREDKGTDGP